MGLCLTIASSCVSSMIYILSMIFPPENDHKMGILMDVSNVHGPPDWVISQADPAGNVLWIPFVYTTRFFLVRFNYSSDNFNNDDR